ncbi:hypothetical protein Dimus_010625 [Dionaea muscipula]
MENRRRILENLLPQQLVFLKSQAIREYLGSEDFVKMFSPIMIHCIVNSFKIALDECKRTLKRDGKTIQCLKNVKFNPDVDYKIEPIPSRLTLYPVVWNIDGPSDPLEYVEKWGQEFLQGCGLLGCSNITDCPHNTSNDWVVVELLLLDSNVENFFKREASSFCMAYAWNNNDCPFVEFTDWSIMEKSPIGLLISDMDLTNGHPPSCYSITSNGGSFMVIGSSMVKTDWADV